MPWLAWTLPAIAIHDAPRFPWRDAMLDVSRHFLPMAFVRRVVAWSPRGARPYADFRRRMGRHVERIAAPGLPMGPLGPLDDDMPA